MKKTYEHNLILIFAWCVAVGATLAASLLTCFILILKP